jgi:D-alanyl-D-alanine carboxypeptidase
MLPQMPMPQVAGLTDPQMVVPVQYDAQGNWDWSPYAAQGATRPDSFTGMADPFESALEQMFANAPPEIRDQLEVRSGYRSEERQAQLWEEALAKYGSAEEARKWVAPPGSSQHNHGNAADLGYLDPAAEAWAHENAAAYGLAFPLGNEPWHVELASARGGGSAPHGGNPGGSSTNQPGHTGHQQPSGLPDPGAPAPEPTGPGIGDSALAALFGKKNEERLAYQQGLGAHGQGPFAKADDGSMNVFGRTLDEEQRKQFSRGLMNAGINMMNMGV